MLTLLATLLATPAAALRPGVSLSVDPAGPTYGFRLTKAAAPEKLYLHGELLVGTRFGVVRPVQFWALEQKPDQMFVHPLAGFTVDVHASRRVYLCFGSYLDLLGPARAVRGIEKEANDPTYWGSDPFPLGLTAPFIFLGNVLGSGEQKAGVGVRATRVLDFEVGVRMSPTVVVAEEAARPSSFGDPTNWCVFFRPYGQIAVDVGRRRR